MCMDVTDHNWNLFGLMGDNISLDGVYGWLDILQDIYLFKKINTNKF